MYFHIWSFFLKIIKSYFKDTFLEVIALGIDLNPRCGFFYLKRMPSSIEFLPDTSKIIM